MADRRRHCNMISGGTGRSQALFLRHIGCAGASASVIATPKLSNINERHHRVYDIAAAEERVDMG
jgi:hypothetical protein